MGTIFNEKFILGRNNTWSHQILHHWKSLFFTREDLKICFTFSYTGTLNLDDPFKGPQITFSILNASRFGQTDFKISWHTEHSLRLAAFHFFLLAHVYTSFLTFIKYKLSLSFFLLFLQLLCCQGYLLIVSFSKYFW